MAQITLANFAASLVQSSVGRAGTPDGNIFFDQANDKIELISVDDLATVIYTDPGHPSYTDGTTPVANPLSQLDGITMQALYAFERQERGTDTSLRTYLPGTEGRFQDAGAFAFDAGVKLDDVNGAVPDRAKIRGSGWTEFANDGGIDRIYFGVRSLNNIEATSQPYVQIPLTLSEANLQAAAPINAARLGPLDEAFQVFGSTANTPSDTGAGNFDYALQPLVAKVRTFGQTQGEASSTSSGVARLKGFSAGFGIGEGISPTAAGDTLADVFTTPVAPYNGLGFFRNATAQTETGFNEADGDFTDTITNTGNASLAQIRAWLDALMASTVDENDNTGTTGSFIPARADVLYTINAEGKLVTRAGLHIDNVPTSDNQNIIQTADNGDQKTYPFANEIRVAVSDAWFNDPNAWYACYFADGAGGLDFDTGSAVIVQDNSAANVVGTAGDARAAGTAGNRTVNFSFNYSGNTQAGLSAGIDKDVVFLAEGDGGAVAARATISIVSQAVITASAVAAAETNI